MKRVVLSFLIMLFLAATANSRTLRGSIWVQQNATNPSEYVTLIFYANSTVVDFGKASIATSRGLQKLTGTYSISDGVLNMQLNIHYSYDIKWITDNKVRLYNGSENLVFARFNSEDDHAIANYYASPHNYVAPRSYEAPERRVTCYTCQGMLSCPVCNGYGRLSFYGQPSYECTYCNGTGRCPHCHGTGIQ